MERISYRQYSTWIAWLDQQWNKPDRSDHYMMQVAAEVRRVLSKKPQSIKLGHFLLKFEFVPPRPTTSKQALAASKAKWFAAVGMVVKDKG